MLVAKAIQDWPLYSGQESSTRYIDFQIQPFKNPLKTKEGEDILESYRKFYIDALGPTKEHLKKQFPINEGENESIYNKAIDARAFDVLRGFLPAGSATNLAWHTNLRQAADKIAILRHHPLLEVRNASSAIEKALILAFPNSFGHKHYEETENYNQYWMTEDYYYHDKNSVRRIPQENRRLRRPVFTGRRAGGGDRRFDPLGRCLETARGAGDSSQPAGARVALADGPGRGADGAGHHRQQADQDHAGDQLALKRPFGQEGPRFRLRASQSPTRRHHQSCAPVGAFTTCFASRRPESSESARHMSTRPSRAQLVPPMATRVDAAKAFESIVMAASRGPGTSAGRHKMESR